MARTTERWGIYSKTVGDNVSPVTESQLQAASIEKALNDLESMRAQIDYDWDASSFFTVGIGWQLDSARLSYYGGVTSMSIEVTRTGDSIPGREDGDMPNSHVATLVELGARPHHMNHVGTTRNGPMVTGVVYGGGDIWISATAPNIGVTNGTKYGLAGTWVNRRGM